MPNYRIQDVRIACGGRWLDGPPTGSCVATGVSTDTRSLLPGEVYVALRGDNHDGHAFLAAARDRGAACAVVAQGAVDPGAFQGMACIVVPDTLTAYGDLAKWHGTNAGLARRIAVAGSNGKTTTRTLVAEVLASAGPVLQNDANENNLVGVPKTLLRLDRHHANAVIEIGTNQLGEIPRLCEILAPHVTILTNIGEEHLEGLGGIEGVLEEESASLRTLGADGVAILNGDDPLSLQARMRARCEVVNFGFDSRSHVRASDFQTSPEGSRFTVNGVHHFTLPLSGRHNVMNALAAIAAGWVCGIDVEAVQAALASVHPVKMRSEIKDIAGVRVIQDCYNANPGSVVAALGMLESMPHSGQRIVCLGDMLEMGVHAEAAHLRLADAVIQVHPDLAIMVGPHMGGLGRVLERAGVPVWHFTDACAAGESIVSELRAGDTVLVKGSRGMRMERITEVFAKRLTSQNSQRRRAA